MRAAHAGSCPQHPLAGGATIPRGKGESPERCGTMGGENARYQGRAGACRGFCRHHARRMPSVGASSRQFSRIRPIGIIGPYPAGGIVDIAARAVTEQVGRDRNRPIVVEARAGGNSNIGTSAVARSEPDGRTWLVTGPAALVDPGLYKDAGWDFKDLRCVGLAVWTQAARSCIP